MKLIPISPILLALSLAACGDKPAAPRSATPAAVVQTATPAAPSVKVDPAVLAKGEAVYSQTCQACHAAGVLGAPKVGDKTAWAAHLAKGTDTLHSNAINGVAMMPPRGGNAMLKDPEVQAAVDFMVSKVN